MQSVNTIIFDLGGVLIDWNPRYLYRKIFQTESEVEWFLGNVCTPEWNEQQDAGRSFAVATEKLIHRFPNHEVAIKSWFARWGETLGGPIKETVDILQILREQRQHRLYALTNWSAETFPLAKSNFGFLEWFEGIVVSGVEKIHKPNPAFYQILFDRYRVIPSQALFIDDSLVNVESARRMGMDSIHYTGSSKLLNELSIRGISLGV